MEDCYPNFSDNILQDKEGAFRRCNSWNCCWSCCSSCPGCPYSRWLPLSTSLNAMFTTVKMYHSAGPVHESQSFCNCESTFWIFILPRWFIFLQTLLQYIFLCIPSLPWTSNYQSSIEMLFLEAMYFEWEHACRLVFLDHTTQEGEEGRRD